MAQRRFFDADTISDLERASFLKETYQADAIRRGQFFQFTRRWTGIADGETVSMYINNTSDDRPITLAAPQIQSNGSARIQVIRNTDTYGTANSQQSSVINLKSGDQDEIAADVDARTGTNVSVTGGNIIEEGLIAGSGQGSNRTGGSSRAGIVTYLGGGDDLLFRVTNTSGAASIFAGTITLIQERRGVPPER